jgi:hypothetical protein
MILLVDHVSNQGHNQEAGNHCNSHLKCYNHSLHSIPEICGAGASIPDQARQVEHQRLASLKQSMSLSAADEESSAVTALQRS